MGSDFLRELVGYETSLQHPMSHRTLRKKDNPETTQSKAGYFIDEFIESFPDGGSGRRLAGVVEWVCNPKRK